MYKINPFHAHKIIAQALYNHGFLQQIVQMDGFEVRRKFIKQHYGNHNVQDLKASLKIMNQNRHDPVQMIKILCFCHLITQEVQNWDHSVVKTLLTDAIAKVLKDCNNYIIKKNASCQGANNSISNGFFGRFLKGNNIDQLSLTKDSTDWSISSPKSDLGQISFLKKQQNQTKEDFLCKKIIIPYASYLLKLVAHHGPDEVAKQQNIQIQHCWIIINSLKSLIKVSENFLQPFRYFRQYYYGLLTMMVEIFNFDFHSSYPLITEGIENKLIAIETDLNINGLNFDDSYEMIESFCIKHRVRQMKQLLNEISLVNEGIVWVHQNKYVSKLLKKQKIPIPNMINNHTNNIDLIYKLEKIYGKKQRKVNKKAENKNREIRSNVMSQSFPYGLLIKQYSQRKSLQDLANAY